MDGGFRPSLRAKYEFGWEILEVVVGGKSTIDAPAGFLAASAAEADRFVRAYGYDLDNPIDAAELLGNFQESLNFIRRHFLKPENPDGLKLEIPRKLVEMTDVRELFVLASSADQSATRSWACAILKVMHTIAHVDKDVRGPYFADVQKQIFDRYYRLIQREGGESGQLYLGERPDDPLRVDLAGFETKPKKSRDSILLKMLHKPENVAEDIFDRVGIRFITRSRLDCLRVIKFLKERMVLVAPNIKPSRSRNTLIEIDSLKAALESRLDAFVRGEIDEAQLVRELEAAASARAASESDPVNPHSSEFYRAIQFTARQLVKFRNPLFEELKDLRNLVRAKAPQDPEDELRKAAERIDLKYVQREVRFFYPYEVQLMDAQSAEDNEKGRSAHSEYKKAQVQTALKRVMGSFDLIPTCDVAIVGNGLAALLAAQNCLKEGLRAVLLNPDADFFLEDSELGLDPCFFSPDESIGQIRARLAASSAEALLARLQPHFPGALGFSAADRPGRSEHEFSETPVVRSRGRIWIDLRQDTAWDEFALRLEEAGSKPAWVDGLTAVRKLPGASGPNVMGSVSRGLVIQGLGDVDLSRFRTGVHDFVIDRFRQSPESGELVLGCTSLELAAGVLKWKTGRDTRVLDPADCRLGAWVFLTPRIARHLHYDVSARPDFLGYRTQEEWVLFSREPLHLGTIGNLKRGSSELCVWAQLDGSFPREGDVFRLNILYQGPRLRALEGGVSVESLGAISEFCLDTLRWGSFSVRSLKSRRVFEWAEAGEPAPAARAEPLRYLPHCDGPVSRVVEQVDRLFRDPRERPL